MALWNSGATWNSGQLWGPVIPPTPIFKTKPRKKPNMKRQPYFPTRTAERPGWFANSCRDPLVLSQVPSCNSSTRFEGCGSYFRY